MSHGKAQMPDSKSEYLPNPVEGWVTIEEAGKLVGRSHSVVRKWANQGKISCYRIGTSIIRIVNVDEVRRYSERTIRFNNRQPVDSDSRTN
jgi:excisionase family DNA binding protein